MKKKLLLIVLSFVCVFACVFGLAACGGNSHTHDYVRRYDETYHWQECTNSGCNAKTIDKEKHKFNTNNCCTACGYVRDSGEDKPGTPEKPDERQHVCAKNLYHFYENTPSTCATQGSELSLYICKYSDETGNFCGKVYEDENASTLVGEIKLYYLENPNYIEQEFKSYTKSLDLLPHTPIIDEAVAATCTTKGLTEGSHCDVCGNVLKAQEETDYAHKFVNIKFQTEENGYKVETACSLCGRMADKDVKYSLSLNDNKTAYTLNGISGTDVGAEIAIPCEFNEKPVTAIGNRAFYNNKMVTGVSIPDSVTNIGNYAFAGCDNLIFNENDNAYYLGNSSNPYLAFIKPKTNEITSLEFHNGTKIIANHALSACINLTDIIIPDSVINIGDYAFMSCQNLANITMGLNVANIGKYAFTECDKIENVYYEGNVTNWCEISGISNLTLNGLTNKNIYFDGSKPSGELILSDGVTVIEDYAFKDCVDITSVILPNSIVSVSSKAFDGCINLQYNEYDNAYYLGNAANPYLALIKAKSKDITSCSIQTSTKLIASYAFESCVAITTLQIPDNIIGIGKRAFADCDRLISVTIGNGVTDLNKESFYSCDRLENVTIDANNAAYCSVGNIIYNRAKTALIFVPKAITGIVDLPAGVVEINDSAFNGCSKITGINIPSSVTRIGIGAFSYCSSIESITIPDSVTVIGDSAFYNCSALIDVTFGNGITNISGYAFAGCEKLMNVTFGNKITTIGESAFKDCPSIRTIVLSNSVKTIGNSAFENCSLLTSVTLGKSLTTISNSAFSGCRKLVEVYNLSDIELTKGSGNNGGVAFYALNLCASENDKGTVYYTTDGYIFYVYESSMFLLGHIGIATSLILPEKYNGQFYAINAYAFYEDTNLTSITLPDGLIGIGDYAFYSSVLREITVPDSNTYIGRYSFGYNYYLQELNINGTTSIGDYAFYNCTRLKTLQLGNEVKSIGKYSFDDCSDLTTVIIPESVSEIGYSAFSGCQNLESITLPFVGSSKNAEYSSETTLFGYIFGFNEDTGIEITQQYGSSNSSRRTYYIPASLVSVTVTGENLFNGAFSDCRNITSLTIGDSIKSIGNNAFIGCSSIERITYLGDLTSWCKINGLGGLLQYGSSSRTIYIDEKEISDVLIIPDGVTSISAFAFYNCNSITGITIPSGVQSIGDNAFYGCGALETINWNATACQIAGSYTKPIFDSCSNVSAINFGNNVAYIPDYTFSGCTNITTIIIPDSVKGIGYGSFIGCPIETATIPAVACNYIDNSSLKTVIITSGDSIAQNAFYGSRSLTSITIPDSVTNIGEYAFGTCNLLEGIKYTGNIASWCGISGLDNLNHSKVYIGNQKLGELTALTIPNGVAKISSYAFYNCNLLKTISIPDSVKSIGDYAFAECVSVGKLTLLCDDAVISSSAFNSINAAIATVSLNNLSFLNNNSLLELEITRGSNITDANLSELTQLTTLKLGKGVSGINQPSTFDICENLERIIVDANNREYASLDGILYRLDMPQYVYCIPKKLSGNIEIRSGVTSIWGGQFSQYANITGITLPDSVTSIEYSAFRECSGLKYISMGNGVRTIGQVAFGYCSSLETLNLPDSVISVGDYTNGIFSNCSSLKSITVGKNLTEFYGIASDASSCNLLEEIVVSENNSVYASQNGILYNKAKSEILCVPKMVKGDIILPQSLQDLPDNDNESSMTAFVGRNNITSISIPSSIKNVGDYMFAHCENLETVTIANGINSIGWASFTDCTKLKSINLPDSLTSIGESAFYGCSSLTSITIPDSITSIGNNAFNGCNNLNYNEYENCLYLGNNANPYLILKSAKNKSDSIDSRVVHDDTKFICDNAFNGCSWLSNITIGKSVIDIGNNAFNGCNVLSKVYYTGDIANWCGISGLNNLSLYNKTVYIEGKEITGNLVIPDNVAIIGDYAFINSKLTDITISNNVTHIGSSAFSYCYRINSITIGKSVISIGEMAFYQCSALTNIIFSGTIEEWNAIEKNNGWNGNTGNYIIRCTDGNLDKNGNKINE